MNEKRSADSMASRFQGLGRSASRYFRERRTSQDKKYSQVLAIMNKLL